MRLQSNCQSHLLMYRWMRRSIIVRPSTSLPWNQKHNPDIEPKRKDVIWWENDIEDEAVSDFLMEVCINHLVWRYLWRGRRSTKKKQYYKKQFYYECIKVHGLVSGLGRTGQELNHRVAEEQSCRSFHPAQRASWGWRFMGMGRFLYIYRWLWMHHVDRCGTPRWRGTEIQGNLSKRKLLQRLWMVHTRWVYTPLLRTVWIRCQQSRQSRPRAIQISRWRRRRWINNDFLVILQNSVRKAD